MRINKLLRSSPYQIKNCKEARPTLREVIAANKEQLNYVTPRLESALTSISMQENKPSISQVSEFTLGQKRPPTTPIGNYPAANFV